jgi:hypothetical protein
VAILKTVRLKELFNEVVARGWGEEDFAVLYRFLDGGRL